MTFLSHCIRVNSMFIQAEWYWSFKNQKCDPAARPPSTLKWLWYLKTIHKITDIFWYYYYVVSTFWNYYMSKKELQNLFDYTRSTLMLVHYYNVAITAMLDRYASPVDITFRSRRSCKWFLRSVSKSQEVCSRTWALFSTKEGPSWPHYLGGKSAVDACAVQQETDSSDNG